MCQLVQSLNEYLAAHHIPEQALEYCWRGKNESETDLRFADYHRRLNAAVRRHRRGDVRDCVIEIVHDWGGIANYQGLADRYPDCLLHLDENNPVGNRNDTPLSSWSKVLAAYAPDKFNIYDTRVAVALRILIPGNQCFLPTARGNRERLLQHLGRNGQRSQKDSYAFYMDLLHGTGNPLRYERKLFMLGGLIGFDETRNAITINI